MRKAAQALASAHQLLAGGDADGACNRAYYAMIDAAHAALRSANVAETASATKTHRGLIAAFGQHLVLGGHVASEIGSSLNKQEEHTSETKSLMRSPSAVSFVKKIKIH